MAMSPGSGPSPYSLILLGDDMLLFNREEYDPGAGDLACARARRSGQGQSLIYRGPFIRGHRQAAARRGKNSAAWSGRQKGEARQYLLRLAQAGALRNPSY